LLYAYKTNVRVSYNIYALFICVDVARKQDVVRQQVYLLSFTASDMLSRSNETKLEGKKKRKKEPL
jgi:hypothetical protein